MASQTILVAVEQLEHRAEQIVGILPALEGPAVNVTLDPPGRFVRVVHQIERLHLPACPKALQTAQPFEDVSRWVDEKRRAIPAVSGVIRGQERPPFANELADLGRYDAQ
jgi:hypothetical protein